MPVPKATTFRSDDDDNGKVDERIETNPGGSIGSWFDALASTVDDELVHMSS